MKSVLKRHQRNIHFEKKKWLCDHCGSTFSSKDHLSQHLKVHLPPSYSCTKCDKKFVYAGALRGHLKQHDGILNAVCKHCSKRFTSTAHLGAHITREHFEKIPCAVPGCVASFRGKGCYKDHLRNVHNDVDTVLIGILLNMAKLLKPDHQKLKFV